MSPILDADKEGLFRSETSLIQTIGRAARNAEGRVIMYADTITKSMKAAIDETERRRTIQIQYNTEHGITPQTIQKAVHELIEIGISKAKEEKLADIAPKKKLSSDEKASLAAELTKQMKEAAKQLDFERAAYLRDKIASLRTK